MSDNYKLIEVPGGMLWEIDCKKIAKGAESFGESRPSSRSDKGDGIADLISNGFIVFFSLQSSPEPTLPPKKRPRSEKTGSR